MLATVFRLDLCFSKLKCFAGKTSRGIVSSSVSSSAGNVVFRYPPTNMGTQCHAGAKRPALPVTSLEILINFVLFSH